MCRVDIVVADQSEGEVVVDICVLSIDLYLADRQLCINLSAGTDLL